MSIGIVNSMGRKHLKEQVMSRLNLIFSCMLFLLLFDGRQEAFSKEEALSAAGKISFVKEIILSPAEKAWLSGNHTVRVRVSNWPPFMFADDRIQGISIDYLESIFALHNIKFQYVTGISWPVALEELKNKRNIDMVLTINRTPAREPFYAFTQDYLFSPRVIFTRDDADFISNIDGLRKKVVSVESGYVAKSLLERQYPDIKLMVVSGENLTEQALSALATGQADAYVGNLAVASYLIRHKGFSNIKVATSSPFPDHNQAMGIRNDWPELAGIINKSLNAMPPEQHAAIHNRWLSVRYEHGLQSGDVIKWVLVTVGTAIAIILIILYWNRRLSLEIKRREKVEEELSETIVARTLTTVELQEALKKVKALSGLLPICADCKKIRDDSGYWHQVEVYFREHSEADFSHGICPECMEKHYPEIFSDKVED